MRFHTAGFKMVSTTDWHNNLLELVDLDDLFLLETSLLFKKLMEDILVDQKFKKSHDFSSQKDFVKRMLRSQWQYGITMDFLESVLERMVKSDSDEYDIMEELAKYTTINGKLRKG